MLTCISITRGLVRTDASGPQSQSFWFSQSLVISNNLHILTSSGVMLGCWSGIRLWNRALTDVCCFTFPRLGETPQLHAAARPSAQVQAPSPSHLRALLVAEPVRMDWNEGWEEAQVPLFLGWALLLQLWQLTFPIPCEWSWLHRDTCTEGLT